jgi:hypothetical protein
LLGEKETRVTPERPGTTYLVERYWPGISEPLLLLAISRLQRVTAEVTRADAPVTHLGSVLVGDEQVVFSLIQAASEEVVREVNERAHMPVDRIWSSSLHGFSSIADL